MMAVEKLPTAVPKLRFPEFRGAGKWDRTKLGRIGEFVGGGTPNTFVPEYWGGDIQWFTPTEIKDSKPPKSKRTITSEGLSNSSAKLLPTGALLITTRATIGDVGIADCPCATNQGFQSLVVADSEVNTFWYYWLIQHRNELTDRASGSTFLEIGKTELKQIFALRPDKEEQQKIADCLGSLDDLITAEGGKLEALRQHKQGLVQQLFPQPSETVPRLRFSEFRDEGTWRVKTLRQLLKAEVSAIAQKELGLTNNGYPVYGASGLVGHSDKYEQDEDYIAIVKDGSGVGRVNIFRKYTSVLGTLNYLKLIDHNDHHLTWVYYLLSTLDFSKYVVGTGIPHIYFKDYSNESVPVPSLLEQQKIADCLGSLDDLIAAKDQKLDALRQHKRGLMQQLFPLLYGQ